MPNVTRYFSKYGLPSVLFGCLVACSPVEKSMPLGSGATHDCALRDGHCVSASGGACVELLATIFHPGNQCLGPLVVFDCLDSADPEGTADDSSRECLVAGDGTVFVTRRSTDHQRQDLSPCEESLAHEMQQTSSCDAGGYGGDSPCDVCAEGLICHYLVAECHPPGGLDDPCSRNTECEGEFICRYDEITGVAMPVGSCGPPAAQGELCFVRYECAEGLLCNRAFDDRADRGQCQPPAQEGELCLRDQECASDLVCHVNGLCGVPGAVDARCDQNHDCITGLICNHALAVSCQPPSPEGGICLRDSDCSGDLVCYATYEAGDCAPAGLTADGDPCMRDLECVDGLVCNHYYRDTVALGLCLLPASEGEPCSIRVEECATGLVCSHYQCVAALLEGELCARDEECTSGLTCNGGYATDTTGGQCHPPQPEGAPCGNDLDCATGHVCQYPTDPTPISGGTCAPTA